MARHLTTTATCPGCYTDFQVERDEDGGGSVETWRCQGQIPDMCFERMCEQCRVKCSDCDLPVCGLHRQKVGTEILCDSCRIQRVKEDAEERASELRVAQSIKRITEVA